MMTDNQIDGFCSTIAALWKAHPNMRFGQLVYNYINRGGADLFYIPDASLLRNMRDIEEKEGR